MGICLSRSRGNATFSGNVQPTRPIAGTGEPQRTAQRPRTDLNPNLNSVTSTAVPQGAGIGECSSNHDTGSIISTHMDIRTQRDIDAARNNKNITSLTFHPGVVTGEKAFSGCTGLTSIFIHPGVTIGVNGFADCTGLTSIFISQRAMISDGAFCHCTSLTSIVIPQGVRIGNLAFSHCIKLTSVVFLQEAIIGEMAFFRCTNLTSIAIHQRVTIESLAFNYCTGLTSIVIYQGVKIGVNGFADCTGLTSIVIHQGVTIGENGFADCMRLTSVVIHQGATIGKGAFDSCMRLTSVYVMCSNEGDHVGWTEQNKPFSLRPDITFHFIHERAIMKIIKKVMIYIPKPLLEIPNQPLESPYQLLEIPIYPNNFNQIAGRISQRPFANNDEIKSLQYTQNLAEKLYLSGPNGDSFRQMFLNLFLIQARKCRTELEMPNQIFPEEMWLKIFSYLLYEEGSKVVDNFESSVRMLCPR